MWLQLPPEYRLLRRGLLPLLCIRLQIARLLLNETILVRGRVVAPGSLLGLILLSGLCQCRLLHSTEILLQIVLLAVIVILVCYADLVGVEVGELVECVQDNDSVAERADGDPLISEELWVPVLFVYIVLVFLQNQPFFVRVVVDQGAFVNIVAHFLAGVAEGVQLNGGLIVNNLVALHQIGLVVLRVVLDHVYKVFVGKGHDDGWAHNFGTGRPGLQRIERILAEYRSLVQRLQLLLLGLLVAFDKNLNLPAQQIVEARVFFALPLLEEHFVLLQVMVLKVIDQQVLDFLGEVTEQLLRLLDDVRVLFALDPFLNFREGGDSLSAPPASGIRLQFTRCCD